MSGQQYATNSLANAYSRYTDSDRLNQHVQRVTGTVETWWPPAPPLRFRGSKYHDGPVRIFGD